MADTNRELARATIPIDDVDNLMMPGLSRDFRNGVVLLHPDHRLRYWLADLQASVYIKYSLMLPIHGKRSERIELKALPVQ